MTTTKIPAEFLEAITGSEITDGGIGTADIADSGVTTAKIANNAITAAKLPDNVITATHIPDGLITGTHIAGTTITATQIANNAVGTDQLAGIARGKIIYGDSNGDPQLLTIGSNGTALVSDGTDISWGSAGETNRLPLAGGTMTGALVFGDGKVFKTGDDLVIGTGDTGVAFHDGVDSIIPWNITTAGYRNNAIDIGTSSYGFKDLHLVGNALIGGLLTANGINLGKAFGTSSIMLGDSTTGTIDAANYNTGVGVDVFQDLTTGDSNAAFGFKSLFNLTAGHNNTGYGESTLRALTDASNNTAVGFSALTANTSGHSNVAVGSYALVANEGAIHNIAVGYNAGGSLNSGGYNVAIGTDALKTATTTTANVAVGERALEDTTGEQNTAIGSHVLRENTSGNANVGLGYFALGTATTATKNTAIGNQAMANGIVTGSYNTALGTEAAYGLTSGTYNVAIGRAALQGTCTGSFNVAIGFQALNGITSGGENICIGREAGHDISSANGNVAIGHESLMKCSSAAGNTMVGFQAGENCTGGSNTMIGYKAGEATEGGVYNVFIGQDTRGTHPSHSQQIAIGYNIDAAPGQVAIGTSGSGKVYNEFNTDALWSQGSDVRLKKNITDSTLGLDFINDLRPVTYTWKPSNELPEDFPMYQEENGRDIETVMTGLIAQEVKTAIDTSGVSRFGGWGEDNDGIQQIRAQAFVYPLIKAVQELTTKLEAAEARIKTLEDA